MRQLRRRSALLLCLTSALGLGYLAGPASAGAAIVAIGDQNVDTFTDPNFRALGVKRARLFTPWDSIFREPERLDAWLRTARAARIEPHVAFNTARSNRCPANPCRLPSVRQYTRAFKAFRRKYPYVRVITPWNEVNSPTQPTGKNPRRAAEFYNAAKANCRRCQVLAADILDLSPRTMTRYLRTFNRYVRGNPRLWGLHNYSDTNRFRSTGTQTMLRLVRGDVWLTETGGIFKFRGGRRPLRASESRQARATTHMFSLASRYRRRIKRLYIYQWKANNEADIFDAGLVAPNGKPRRAYRIVRSHRREIR